MGREICNWVCLGIVLLVLFSFRARAAEDADVFSDSSGEASWQDNSALIFRANHNFAVTAGIAQGVWDVGEFGAISNESIPATGGFGKFQYSFHLPIYLGFGYMLGSSLGFVAERVNSEAGFDPGRSFHLPGFLIGLVYNFTPQWRAISAADVYVERIEGMRATKGGHERSLSVSMVTFFDLLLSVDFFYSLEWAIRLEGHKRWTRYISPGESERRTVGASIEKSDHWFGAGLVYHLL